MDWLIVTACFCGKVWNGIRTVWCFSCHVGFGIVSDLSKGCSVDRQKFIWKSMDNRGIDEIAQMAPTDNEACFQPKKQVLSSETHCPQYSQWKHTSRGLYQGLRMTDSAWLEQFPHCLGCSKVTKNTTERNNPKQSKWAKGIKTAETTASQLHSIPPQRGFYDLLLLLDTIFFFFFFYYLRVWYSTKEMLQVCMFSILLFASNCNPDSVSMILPLLLSVSR